MMAVAEGIPTLELRDPRKRFGKTEIICGANLAVKAGGRVAIIGPNGAGKSTIRASGESVLLIEQKLTIAMRISDRALAMGYGSIVFDGTTEGLRENKVVRKEWLEV